MKKNIKGFALPMLLVFMIGFGGIALVLATAINDGSVNYYKQHKRIQASNYAVEGIELVKGYMLTELNKDKKNAWRNIIYPLSGDYRVGFNNGEYILVSQTEEIIEKDYPYAVDYDRTVNITQGDSSDEKTITVTVGYGEGLNKVSYDTTLVNLYGD